MSYIKHRFLFNYVNIKFCVLEYSFQKIEIYISQLTRYGVKSLVSVESLNYFNFSLNNKSVIQATSGDITEKILFSKMILVRFILGCGEGF